MQMMAVTQTLREGERRRTGTLDLPQRADVAQVVERVLGKDEVTGSSPVIGSTSCEGALGLKK